MSDAFWRHKSLEQLNADEWERLCDRCGLCCLVKLEDEDTGVVHYTDLACELLDCATATCSDYTCRKARVPHCVTLTPAAVPISHWLPDTCGYRRVHEGRELEPWHPLRSGRPDSAQVAGQGAAGRVIPATQVPEAQWQDRVVHWPQC